MWKAIALITLFAALPCLAAKKDTIRLPDMSVHTDFGDFLLKDLAQVGRPPFRRLSGTIVNNTSKTWYAPIFEFHLEGPNGVPIDCTPECRVTVMGSIAPAAHISFGEDTTSQPLGIFVIAQLTSPHELTEVTLAPTPVYSADYRFTMTKPAESRSLQFEDDNFAFSVVPDYKGIKIGIQNKRPAEATLDWNGASMIGAAGESLPVVHQGLKYTDASSAKPPTIIPPSGRMDDLIAPVASLRFQDQAWGAGNWLPYGPLAVTYKGKTFGVTVPLSVTGNTKTYTFEFRIDDVQ